jgi:hypothetical protein
LNTDDDACLNQGYPPNLKMFPAFLGSAPTAPGSRAAAVPDPISVAAQAERAVREAFEMRFGGRAIPYEQAREMVWLEREVVDNVVAALREPGIRGDAP